MKLFELSWSDYEMYYYYLFTHKNKTEEEFKEDVKFLLRKYGYDYLKSEDSWAGASDWIKFISPKMSELGYSPIEPIRCGFEGAYIIKKNRPDTIEWGGVVGEELLYKAILHNHNLQKRLEIP